MKRAHEVTVVAFAHDEQDVLAARELERKGIPTHAVRYRDRWKKVAALHLLSTGKPLTLGVYGSRELQAIVDRLIGRCDLAYAYSSSMGAFLEPHAGTPRIMHFGELDSDKWRQYGERSSFPMNWVYHREQRTLLEFERRIARSFSENVLCTPREQEIFAEQIDGASSVVLRNGVDLERFAPRTERAEPGHIVFTGVMNYYPNADGCIWFAHEILPRVRRVVPAARFTIVGAHPTRAVRALARLPGVGVTGSVEDTRDWLARAAVAVAPLRIARGIQNKVLEALAMGLPVVGTTSATQGVDGVAGRDYLVADDTERFADAVSGLLLRPEDAHALGLCGRRLVEENYNWELVFAPLDTILGRLAPQSRGGAGDARAVAVDESRRQCRP